LNTTYDDIFTCFLENTGVDISRLPQTDVGKYEMIHNAIRHYNSKISDLDEVGKLTYDDDTEKINVKLDDTRLLILAYCMKYVYLENELVAFQALWSPFQREIGIKDYRSQVQGRENTLQRTEQKIYEFLSVIEDKSIM